jgi:hypothetical protein
VFASWLDSLWNEDDRADLIKALAWPEDRDRIELEEQDRSIRETAALLGIKVTW